MNAPLAQDIHEPKSLTEAGALLKERGENAALIAGGTDLIIKLKEGVAQAEILIDVMKLPLSYIKGSRTRGIQIGATTTAEQVCNSALLQKELPVLSDAALHLGGPQTQAMATVGGNLCNASPCANFTNVLVALEAQIKIFSIEGERTLPISDFFRGPGVTVLKPTEMVTEIIIPGFSGPYGAYYVKHTLRREMDIAIVGAVAVLIREDQVMKKVRIALGSVGATVILAKSAQQVLEGKPFNLSRTATAAKLAAEKDASYIDDVRASAAYRAVITEYAVKKAVTEAWVLAKGGQK
jgi:CO/xanthine dehydrogenase FAD-binding subunit